MDSDTLIVNNSSTSTEQLSCEASSSKKRRKCPEFGSSRGSQYLLPSQKRDKSKSKMKFSEELQYTSSEEAHRILSEQLKNCCSNSDGNFGGCIGKHFTTKSSNDSITTVDYNKCIEFFMKCRKKIDGRSSDARDTFMTKAFRDSVTSIRTSSDGKVKLVHDFKLQIEETSIIVCRKSFASAYRYSAYSMDQLSEAIKIERETEQVGNVITNYSNTKKRKWGDDKIDSEYTYNKTKDLFQRNIFDLMDGNEEGTIKFVGKDMIRAALTPLAEKQQHCRLWLEEYFNICGDHVPNEDEIRLSISEKKDVYEKYKEDFDKMQMAIVDEKTFGNLWNVIFPNCVIRTYVDIPGKCNTCYHIDRLRREVNDERVHRKLSEAHHLHRGGLFMLERQEYKKRVYYALKMNSMDEKPKVLSMIIDGMDQNNCRLPHLGTQSQFSSPLKQAITGVLEHGVGLTLYRTMNTINKGADLTMYCILAQIESWKEKNGQYPNELFVQADGGSENANQYVLALLELLVVKRIVAKVLFTRLPTGHTHEDIDACFSVVSKVFKTNHCETYQKFASLVSEAFRKPHPAVIKDLYVVPNYTRFLEGCIDSKLSRLHKDVQTQHQWRFEAVKRSIYFPHGCKVNYRAYSSDEVVEFTVKLKEHCRSEIGQYTGLEPALVFSKWYPSADCIQGRQVEGFYLLRDIPHWDIHQNRLFPCCLLPNKCSEEIQATLNEVRSTFNDRKIRQQWEDWFAKFGPRSDDTEQYLSFLQQNRFRYHLPLREILLSKDRMLNDDRISLPSSYFPVIESSMQLPETLAAAMPSVASEFMNNPPNPRLYVSTNAVAQANAAIYKNATELFYFQLANSSLTELKEYNLVHKAVVGGEVVKTSGSKTTIIDRIKRWDLFLWTILSSKLTGVIHFYVAEVLTKDRTSVELEELVPPSTHSLTYAVIRELNPGRRISQTLMNQILDMFAKREVMISQQVTTRKKSKYCSVDFSNYLTGNEPVDIDHIKDYISPQENILTAYSSFYFAFELCEMDSWCLLHVDFDRKRLQFIDSHRRCLNQLEDHRNIVDHLVQRLNQIIQILYIEHNIPNFTNWNIIDYPNLLFEPQQNENDSGIIIAIVIYFITLKAPVYFSQASLYDVRKNFAHWLIKDKMLPL